MPPTDISRDFYTSSECRSWRGVFQSLETVLFAPVSGQRRRSGYIGPGSHQMGYFGDVAFSQRVVPSLYVCLAARRNGGIIAPAGIAAAGTFHEQRHHRLALCGCKPAGNFFYGSRQCQPASCVLDPGAATVTLAIAPCNSHGHIASRNLRQMGKSHHAVVWAAVHSRAIFACVKSAAGGTLVLRTA